MRIFPHKDQSGRITLQDLNEKIILPLCATLVASSPMATKIRLQSETSRSSGHKRLPEKTSKPSVTRHRTRGVARDNARLALRIHLIRGRFTRKLRRLARKSTKRALSSEISEKVRAIDGQNVDTEHPRNTCAKLVLPRNSGHRPF